MATYSNGITIGDAVDAFSNAGDTIIYTAPANTFAIVNIGTTGTASVRLQAVSGQDIALITGAATQLQNVVIPTGQKIRAICPGGSSVTVIGQEYIADAP
jgi:hypothetical protein